MGQEAYSNQVMAAIVRSTQLPVSTEYVLSNLTPPMPGYQPPQGRTDLVITDSDFSTILPDIAVTHPNPSENQAIHAFMLQPGHFAVSRENSKR